MSRKSKLPSKRCLHLSKSWTEASRRQALTPWFTKSSSDVWERSGHTFIYQFHNTDNQSCRIQAFEEAQNVIVFFPSESDEESFDVLLVYNPLSDTGNAPVADKQKHLAEAEKELLKLAADAADVTTETIIVEKKWHSAVVGKNGSTLNS